MRNDQRQSWVVLIALVWLAALLSAVWWIGGEVAFSGSACVRTVGEGSAAHDVHGSATSQWFPPGRVCHYDDGVTTKPSDARSVVVGLLLATSPFVVMLTKRKPVTAPADLSRDQVAITP